MTKTVLYLHGFASSSRSEKSLLTQAYFRQYLPDIRLLSPDLPYTPAEAMTVINTALADTVPAAVIGSSLGGFLSTCLAERYGCRACLINPAVAPHRVLSRFLGEYEHPVLRQRYQVKQEHMTELEQLMPQQLAQPQNYLVLLQTGDEVLDYRQALSFYQGANIELVQGGDHSFKGYADYLPAIAKFCQLA
ncbi:YqiA/YcfP family alpha/beta fold hydrolase [Chromatiaceae bacterium AAb-1]|nr:YqiA/YcfP family alpha/beta fold hydrolase [Chromatiaceae bacterium AAb-1]